MKVKDEKVIKVKIVKCSCPDDYWYANAVGEIIEVYESFVPKETYNVAHGIRMNILKKDCEVIEELK